MVVEDLAGTSIQPYYERCEGRMYSRCSRQVDVQDSRPRPYWKHDVVAAATIYVITTHFLAVPSQTSS